MELECSDITERTGEASLSSAQQGCFLWGNVCLGLQPGAWCSHFLSIVVIKHSDQELLDAGWGWYLSHTSVHHGWKPGLEHKHKSWRNATCWHIFLYSLGPSAQGMVPPTVGWGLVYQIIIKTIPHRHAHKWFDLEIPQ